MKFVAHVVVLLTLLGAVGAAAQTPEGAIHGHVKDAQQAFLPGVAVAAVSASSQRTYTGITDTEGFYRLRGLAPGEYTVRAELLNFTTFERTGVVVSAETDLGLNITLEISQFADRVDVFAAAPSSGYRASESVAATRIAVPLQDLPINVQVVPAEFLNDAVVLDIVDTMQYKAVNANRDIRFNSMFIRGFNNRILKRNGVRRDLNWGTANVESVEIVKGPASILYGEAKYTPIASLATSRAPTAPPTLQR
jgi:outer membrane receptor protein involved in Fe transport